jgi:hypothetical protein
MVGVACPPSIEILYKNLEKYLGMVDFVETPHLYNQKGGGWKIHVGLGMRNSSDPRERENVVQILREIIGLLQKYDGVGAKFAGFKVMEEFSDYNNPQRGKQVTIYVSEDVSYLVAIIAGHLSKIIRENKDRNLTLVRADTSTNIPLVDGGVISVRWSSCFAPHSPKEKAIDYAERYGNAMEIVERRGKWKEFINIYNTFKTLQEARYLSRADVEKYLGKGEKDKLIGNIVAIPVKGKRGEEYHAHLIGDVYYEGGRYRLAVYDLEDPSRTKKVVDITNISRTPQKIFKYETLGTFVLILISLFALSLSISNISSFSGSFISTLTKHSIFFPFLFLSLFLVALIIYYKTTKKSIS